MHAKAQRRKKREEALLPWFLFWGQILVLVVLAVIGFFFARAARAPGDYAVGLSLSLSAIAFLFLRIKLFFDGEERSFFDLLFAESMAELSVAIPLSVVVGLAGLLIAFAAKEGSLYSAGLGLFVAAVLAVFLNIKRVYDRIEGRAD